MEHTINGKSNGRKKETKQRKEKRIFLKKKKKRLCYLDESRLEKPPRESSDICTNYFDIQRFKDLTNFYHCVCSFAASEAHHHCLLSH